MKKAFWLALSYTLLIFASLYFVPFFTDFLLHHNLLENFVDTTHLAFGILLVMLFFRKYKIKNLRAYFLFFLVLIVFLGLFLNARFLQERFHYMEYTLFFVLWFRVIRYLWPNGFCYLATFFLTSAIGVLDETAQKFLPNRYFDWNDIGINLLGGLIGVAVVLILMRYRQDKKNSNSVGFATALLFFSLLCGAPSLQAAPLNVDMVEEQDVAVYDGINQLVALGLIDTINLGQRPWSRNEIVRMVKEAVSNLGRLRNVPQEIQAKQTLKFLSRRYKLEMEGVSEIAFYPLREILFEYLYLDSPNRTVPVTVGTTDAIQAFINPLTSYKKGRAYEDTNNVGIQTTHELDVTKYFSVWAAPNFLFRQNKGQEDYVQVGFDELYGRTEFANVGIQTGRDVLGWGQGPYGGVFNSTNATPLDMLKISNVSPFYYPAFLKYLGPSSIGFFIGLMEANRVFSRDYITGMKLTFQPLKVFEFGLTTELISGGRGAPKASVGKRIADFFGIFTEAFGQDPNISDRVGGFDFRIRIPPWRGLEIYYEVLFEDLLPPPHWATMFVDEAIHQAGLFLPRLNDIGTQNLRLEFIYAGFRAYRHHQFRSGWTRNSRIMGSEMGPESMGAALIFEDRPTYYFVQTHQFAVENRGSNFYRFLGDATSVEVTRHNPSETRYRWVSAFTLESKPQVDWTLAFGYERVQQFNFVVGDNRNNFLVNLRMNVYPRGKVAKK